eukprot:augustus_masked-scaffold_15-processed-gene-1.37-mRNA-1 protein AED:0.42 eAED:0.42 QI:0/-1/0/1/-1/1/1/0/460
MPSEPLNHNVKVALAYTSTVSVGVGMWGSTVLSAYLKGLTGTFARVGFAEGLQGIATLCFAFPAGLLSDRFGRDKVLRFASILGFLSCFVLLCSLSVNALSEEIQYGLIISGLVLWGAFVGSVSAPLEALYADSTSLENRAEMNQYKFSLLLLSASVGPFISILMFIFLGDQWTMDRLRTVFEAGLLFSGSAVFFLFAFDDKKSLVALVSEEETTESLEEPLLDSDVEEDQDLKALDRKNKSFCQESELDVDEETLKRKELAYKYVPVLMTSSDMIGGVASGMTIKFFPLFFKEETGLSPIAVSCVMLCATLSVSFGSYFARVTAGKIGRAKTLLVFQVPGTFLLFSMYAMSIGYDIKTPGQVPLWRNEFVIIPVYLVRTMLMNAVSPIKKAILMDHVKPQDRGFWNAFDSVFKFGWSGSAFLGGWLMDHFGYGYTFLATSFLQFIYAFGIGMALLKLLD